MRKIAFIFFIFHFTLIWPYERWPNLIFLSAYSSFIAYLVCVLKGMGRHCDGQYNSPLSGWFHRYYNILYPAAPCLWPVLCGGRRCWARRVVSSLHTGSNVKYMLAPAWLPSLKRGVFHWNWRKNRAWSRLVWWDFNISAHGLMLTTSVRLKCWRVLARIVKVRNW